MVRFRGWWCRSGAEEVPFAIDEDGKVSFNGGAFHGLSAFSTTGAGRPILIMAFHHEADETKLVPKLLYQMSHQVWIESDNYTMLVDPEAGSSRARGGSSA